VRIGLFSNNYLPFRGGVTTSIETLRRGLEARGHAVWVIAPASAGADADPRVLRCPALPAATYPDFALPLPVLPGFARRVRALRLDLFHAHHPFLLGPAARRLARQAGRPLVFTYHTRYEKYAHYVPFRRAAVEAAAVRLSTRFAASADVVIAPSQGVRETLAARGVQAPIAVVPTGVDLARFSPGDPVAARHGLGLPGADPVLLYVGRLDPEKSVERVLGAFARVHGVVPGARLVLVGAGTQRRRLQSLAAALPGADRITFLPARPHLELPACYRAADVFLFASETETQGLVLVEAAACGIPVVSVSAPGCDEVVQDGGTGLLVKPDPAALAEGAVGLLLDRDRRRRLGLAARAHAVRAFDARSQVDRTLEVYERARRRS
jgi:glycosyltransferase involved in cell wall biosynthesis